MVDGKPSLVAGKQATNSLLALVQDNTFLLTVFDIFRSSQHFPWHLLSEGGDGKSVLVHALHHHICVAGLVGGYELHHKHGMALVRFAVLLNFKVAN